ncbi:MAG: hypothetical protein HY644_15435 [Acidobacteria bacterium]|nr:hypothetical protein [Acidobacteriota bacterium]
MCLELRRKNRSGNASQLPARSDSAGEPARRGAIRFPGNLKVSSTTLPIDEIIHGDCLQFLKKKDCFPDDCIDLMVTDPPYGYSFMGKDWDRAVPSVEIWKECLRVLKPGAFAFIMSAPRADVLGEMTCRLQEAGFRLDFTPLYHSYASGFPKAMNISKTMDKKFRAERVVLGRNPNDRPKHENAKAFPTAPATPPAKPLDGSYGGFQPKPAVEVILVAMKPLSEKTFVEQALTNGKGIT